MNKSLSNKSKTLRNTPKFVERVWKRAHRWLNWTTLAFVMVSLVALFAVGLIVWNGIVEHRMRRFYEEFVSLETPQRVHTLARMFRQQNPLNPRGYVREAHELFFGLSREEQFALFTPKMLEEDVVTVIAELYTTLADVDETNATTELLQRMRDALPSKSPHQAAYKLRIELLAWITARELFASGQHTLALESYDIAINLNCENIALWYEKARVRLELGETSEALKDLEQALTPTCPPQSPPMATPEAAAITTSIVAPVPTPQPAIMPAPEFSGIQSQFRDIAQIRRAIKALIYRYPAAALALTADAQTYAHLRQAAGLFLILTPTPTARVTFTPTYIPPTPTASIAAAPSTPTSNPTLIPTPSATIESALMPEATGFRLVWPTQFKFITQRFGENPEIYQKFGLPGSEGIDFQATTGSEIYAAADGVVSDVRLDGDTDPTTKPYGNQVRIQHADGYESIYAHLSQVLVMQGQAVKAGQLIGLAGNTGNSFGAHLTFILKLAGATANGITNYPSDIIDPTPYLLPFGASSSSKPGGYIFGIHNVSISDYISYNGGEFLMEEKGKFGWVLFTEQVGRNADNLQPAPEIAKAFQQIADKRFRIIVRLNHGYEPGGTLPESQYYDDFALAVRRWIELYGESVHIWVIGNDINNPREHPGGFDFPTEHITPKLYAECYAKVWTAIRTLPGHENDQVVVASLDPWSYMPWKGNNNKFVRPLDYFTELLDELRKTDVPIDALALHAYTYTSDPESIFRDEWFGGGSGELGDHRFGFRSYRDYMHRIPEDLQYIPVYITEASPIYSSEDETSQGWPDANRGWIQNAYREIYDWNKTAGNQQIRALILYRWMGDQWQIMNKYGLYEDFQAAMDYDYVWFDTQD